MRSEKAYALLVVEGGHYLETVRQHYDVVAAATNRRGEKVDWRTPYPIAQVEADAASYSLYRARGEKSRTVAAVCLTTEPYSYAGSWAPEELKETGALYIGRAAMLPGRGIGRKYIWPQVAELAIATGAAMLRFACPSDNDRLRAYFFRIPHIDFLGVRAIRNSKNQSLQVSRFQIPARELAPPRYRRP